ncbi:MAG: twin transmembrane helix small protein [Paracoccaceae bacterium]
MSDILSVATVGACVVVLIVLAVGLGGFGSGRASPNFSNRMMRWRIVAQAVALVLLIAFAVASQMGG